MPADETPDAAADAAADTTGTARYNASDRPDSAHGVESNATGTDHTAAGDLTGSEHTAADQTGSARTVDGVTGGFESDDASAPAQVAFAFVSDQPITVEWCVDNVSSDVAGAVVTFSGVVRNHDHGRGVLRLSYTGHPTADEVMRQVADDVAAAHPGTRIAVAHRVGELGVGDVALAAAVASAHRAQAFAACAELVDAVKARVPIWKEQWFTDGTTEWVGAG